MEAELFVIIEGIIEVQIILQMFTVMWRSWDLDELLIDVLPK